MEGYTTKIVECTKELTARERIKVKDTTNALSLIDLVKDGPVILDYDFHAVVEIHNEKSKDNKDYVKYIIGDKGGSLYSTSSPSFFEAVRSIAEEMGEEPFQLEVFTRPSKNYGGKEFLTCMIV